MPDEEKEPSSATTTPVRRERFTICGSKSTHIKLISEDGHEFYIRRCYVVDRSETIKNMLSDFMIYDDDEVAEIEFKEISSKALQCACDYWCYYARHDENW
ncbi:Elongin-C [Aphelenchoides besseyi]|nr:Elongin-C [Aphelenchoides besseyi]